MNDRQDSRLDPFAASLSMSGDLFIAQIAASRELLGLASDSDMREIDLESARQGLTKRQRDEFLEGMRLIGGAIGEALETGGAAKFPLPSGDPAVSRALMRMVTRAAYQARMPSRNLLLRRSMLSLMVSDLELLIGAMMRSALREQPGLVGLDDAAISLAELEALGDVSTARNLVIDRKVDDLLRKSLADWVSWFDRLGVNWKDMTDDWADFVEVFARRNVVVHAGGKASEQYLAALRAGGHPRELLPQVGEELDLDDQYLERASQRLVAFGVLLVGGIWLQLRKESTLPALRWIVSRTHELSDLGYFASVRTVAHTVSAKSRGRLPRSLELSLQILLWVARGELGERVSVQKEVEAWDVAGLDLLYGHAKAVLLEHDDRAVSQIKELMRREELTIVELMSDPLYRGLLERRGSELIPDTAMSGPDVTLSGRVTELDEPMNG